LWQHASNKYGPLTRNSSCAASCTNSCINAVNHTLQRTLHHTLQHTCTNSCIHGVYTEELTNLHVHSKSRNLQCTWRTNLQVHSDTRCQSRTMIHSLYLCMYACMYVCMYIYRHVCVQGFIAIKRRECVCFVRDKNEYSPCTKRGP